MMSGRWRTGCIGIAILAAMATLAIGGRAEIIIPGSIILAGMVILWKTDDTDLYILAVGQLLVYGSAYGSYITAIICEGCLFAAIAGENKIKLLIATFISLTILGTASQMMYHTGWWTAGLMILCIILVISAFVREEAIARTMRNDSDE
ncbi:hypothetical protein L1S32_00915 [Methanogenium sp. S4BF]|uniref:hypothetical protein n=1 Tax=Methanogenium sp. S4BF TaxID=1789226 RepID=UPI002417C325|nr:hypothetical protein [Methanogenium sp. S4BF]WFN34715.1 hypothetical protein L1S32_00915 [Methanogenium sp. S4BF]